MMDQRESYIKIAILEYNVYSMHKDVEKLCSSLKVVKLRPKNNQIQRMILI